MKTSTAFAFAMLAACGLAITFAGHTFAADTADAPDAAPAEPQLTPGWTMEDMQKMMAAGTPGEMHKKLADDVGTWRCKSKMWMTPEGEPVESEGVSVVTPLFDGRYIQVDMNGEMPGMGPYHGHGIYGFDNTAQKFVAIWIDNFSTGMMTGTGELSEDGKTITWTYKANCPIQDGPITLRDVETTTGPNEKTIETFGPDRKTGKEFKMMQLELTREE
jgi:hypothetical protein